MEAKEGKVRMAKIEERRKKGRSRKETKKKGGKIKEEKMEDLG